jgi:Mg-chelatase subunit ChlI
LTSSLHIDGHRADLVILKTARANAAYEGRDFITSQDILWAAELALGHRRKGGPFSEGGVNTTALQNQLQQIEQQWGEGDEDANAQMQPQSDEQKKKANR